MSKIVWDQDGSRFYETGVRNGVLYPKTSTGAYGTGVAWNGLTAVTESPSGAEATALYADDIKYLNLMSNEELGGTIEAYQSPVEFDVCDGTSTLASGVSYYQQPRREFGLCYRTVIGNDASGSDYGYKLHLIYGALASPSERSYATVNDSPEAITLSWEFTTTAVSVTSAKPTARITIDSTKADATKLGYLEQILYGDSTHAPRLPLPDEVISLMATTTSTYSVQNFLSNVTNTNTDSTASGTYSATITADDGYTIVSKVVLHNGVDVTTTAYNATNNTITISSVAGPIVIMVTANATSST